MPLNWRMAMEREFAELKEKLLWLRCLEEAGVDNWQGIEYAQELYLERTNKNAD